MNVTSATGNLALASILASLVGATEITGTRFASFRYTTEQGKTARYNVMLGINLTTLYKHDLVTLKAYRKTLTAGSVEMLACDELIASVTESLEKGIGNNSAYTLKGYYQPITKNGEVKLHEDEKTGKIFLYIRGYVVKETVEVEGTYPKVNSSDKTIAKRQIERGLKRGKIRTFKIDTASLHGIKANGMTLVIS